eukprot:gene10222-11909_t
MLKLTIVSLVVLLLAVCASVESRKPCACSDESLCEVFAPKAPRLEFFGYSCANNTYMDYDWNVLTTLSLDYEVGVPIDPQLICYAHSKGVRVTIDVDFDASTANVGNFTWEQEWIAQTIAMVQDNYLDGIVYDVEQNMDGMQAALFTAMTVQTAYAFKQINPNYWISLDSTYGPYAGSNFDYTGIADALDMIIMMDYDTPSGRVNDPLPQILIGIQDYMDLGIPSNKLLAAVPWYGFDNICEEGCSLENVTCEMVGSVNDIYLADIMAILTSSSIPNTGSIWSDEYTMPLVQYISPVDGQVHRIWYDNPQSIAAKVAVYKPYGFGGIGVFQLETIVGTNLSPTIAQQMWDATATFLN